MVKISKSKEFIFWSRIWADQYVPISTLSPYSCPRVCAPRLPASNSRLPCLVANFSAPRPSRPYIRIPCNPIPHNNVSAPMSARPQLRVQRSGKRKEVALYYNRTSTYSRPISASRMDTTRHHYDYICPTSTPRNRHSAIQLGKGLAWPFARVAFRAHLQGKYAYEKDFRVRHYGRATIFFVTK